MISYFMIFQKESLNMTEKELKEALCKYFLDEKIIAEGGLNLDIEATYLLHHYHQFKQFMELHALKPCSLKQAALSCACVDTTPR